MTLYDLVVDLIGAAWWHTRIAQRLRWWGAILAIAILLIGILTGVYKTEPDPEPESPRAETPQ